MAKPGSGKHDLVKRHKFKLEILAFGVMLVVPFLLYTAAQAQSNVVASALLGLMAITMIALVVVS